MPPHEMQVTQSRSHNWQVHFLIRLRNVVPSKTYLKTQFSLVNASPQIILLRSKMKLTLAAITLATASLVAADPALLAVQADGKDIGYLLSKHEGAGFNYFFVGNSGSAETYDYNPANQQLSFTSGSNVFNFGHQGSYLAIGPAINPEPLSLASNDRISNYNFWACYNTNDPYNYSNSTQVIIITDVLATTQPFPSCTKVDLFKRGPLPSASSTSGGISSNSWSNGTYTSYTTYCPTPTVVTITSCVINVCLPTPITVTAATTITCAQCLLPASTSAAAKSVAKTSSVTLVAGAAKKAIGAVGAMGVAALLL